MKKLIIIAIFLLTGCAHTDIVLKPVCRHNAVYCAVVVEDILDIPTRIAQASSIYPKGYHHAQAQAFYEGRWQWIKLGVTMVIVNDVKDSGWNAAKSWGPAYYFTKEGYVFIMSRPAKKKRREKAQRKVK